jgi:hypothetical protein
MMPRANFWEPPHFSTYEAIIGRSHLIISRMRYPRSVDREEERPCRLLRSGLPSKGEATATRRTTGVEEGATGGLEESIGDSSGPLHWTAIERNEDSQDLHP